MKGAWKFYAVFGLALIALVAGELAAPRPIEWTESYAGSDRNPFGAYILRQQLDSLLTVPLVETRQTLTETLIADEFVATNYIIINDYFDPDPVDIQYLFEYVEAGNTAFIAAKYFGAMFGDSLGFDNYTNRISANAFEGASLARLQWSDTLSVSFVSPAMQDLAQDSVRVGMSYGYFESFDTAKTRVVATDDKGRAVLLRIDRGRGVILLHSVPMAFTNFNLLHPRSAHHAFAALSYMADQVTIWDEYYKSGRAENRSPLRALTSDTSLAMAWYLLLGGTALFLLFGSRRRQRAIPVVTPPANTTVEFVSMIGRLYLERGAHVTIADKKIAYFFEYVRSRLGVRTDRRDDAMVRRVAERSGLPLTQVRAVFARIAVLEHRGDVDDADLLALERDLSEFYSNSQR